MAINWASENRSDLLHLRWWTDTSVVADSNTCLLCDGGHLTSFHGFPHSRERCVARSGQILVRHHAHSKVAASFSTVTVRE